MADTTTELIVSNDVSQTETEESEQATHSQLGDNASQIDQASIKSDDQVNVKAKCLMNFCALYSKGQVVMNNTFLAYLELDEIFRLSLTCTTIRKCIDPASVKTRRRKCKNKLSKATCTFHLKRIAAFQLLAVNLDEKLDHAQIDAIFGLDVRRLSDFGSLGGEIFKRQITSILETEPGIESYCRDLELVARYKEYWQVHGSSLHQLEHLNNPLQSIIRQSKVSYTKGGIFRLRNILYHNAVNSYYLDYDIMIAGIEKQEDYQKLRQIEERARLEEENSEDDQQITSTNFSDISHMVNGVGRLYQYRKVNAGGRITKRSLHGIYDGQIKEGKIDGFGSLLLPELDIKELGYYKKGLLYGKNISLRNVKDVRSIYDVKRMGFGDYYSEFLPGNYSDMDLGENVDEVQMQSIRKKILDGGHVSNPGYRHWLRKECPQMFQQD